MLTAVTLIPGNYVCIGHSGTAQRTVKTQNQQQLFLRISIVKAVATCNNFKMKQPHSSHQVIHMCLDGHSCKHKLELFTGL